MAVFLLKIIFFALSSLTNLVTMLVFKGAALVLVLMIQAVGAPGHTINGLLEQTTSLIKAVFEHIFEIIMGVIASLISACFNLLKEAVSGSVGMTSTAIVELVGKTKDALDGFSKAFPEVFEGVAEIIWNMVSDIWNNYKDAIGYVRENA